MAMCVWALYCWLIKLLSQDHHFWLQKAKTCTAIALAGKIVVTARWFM